MPNEIATLARFALNPQESTLEILKKEKKLYIGLPREVSMQENRITLTPDSVGLLIRNGHEVVIEKDAGLGAKFSDRAYAEAGARVVASPEAVFEADIILKIEPLTENEFEYLKTGQTLFSTLNQPKLEKAYFQKLNDKKITAVGIEHIQDKAGGFPVIRSMSEIAGSTVMLIAAEYLSSVKEGRGIILGGITGVPPTKVVILGAGTVGEYAARTALGLGAEIKIFDKDTFRLQRLKYAIGQHVYTSIIASEALEDALIRADVVIGAIRADVDGLSPMVISETLVARMKSDAIIIDVSIDQGGCFETSEMTSHKNPTYKKHDVIHYCVPNIASRVANTASIALSNIFTPLLLNSGIMGGIDEMIFSNQGFMRGVYAYKGNCTNRGIAQKLDLRYRDLNLLLAARI